MFRIRLFGSGEACYQNNDLPGFPAQTPCLLLSYLVLFRKREHNRDRLSTVLWSDSDNGTARKHLRNCLWRLRAGLKSIGIQPDDYLGITQDRIFFRKDSEYWLDVEAFEAAIVSCRDTPARKLTPQHVERLECAVSLYAGNLIEDVDRDWLLSEREHLYLAFLGTLERLMTYYTFQGDFERGEDYGRRILSLDDTHEATHRQLMRLYWAMGDRCAALEQYHVCARVLRDQLDIPPMTRTTDLYHRICSHPTFPGKEEVFGGSIEGMIDSGRQSTRQSAKLVLSRVRCLQETTAAVSTELDELERLVESIVTGEATFEPQHKYR